MIPGKQLSKKALEIIRAGQSLKSHAYDEAPNEHARLKLRELVLLVREGQELMAEPLNLDLAEEEEGANGGSGDLFVGSSGSGSGGLSGDSTLPSSPST